MSDKNWLVYTVLAMLVLQLLLTGGLVIVGAVAMGRYAERVDEIKREVEKSSDWWTIDRSNQTLVQQRFEMRLTDLEKELDNP